LVLRAASAQFHGRDEQRPKKPTSSTTILDGFAGPFGADRRRFVLIL
jgi:hypothetical protein